MYIYKQMLKLCPFEVSFAFCQYALWNKLYKNTCYSFPKKSLTQKEVENERNILA